ncbi:hypothetical protein T4A_350 [Trichinella pseudospiralis]|uniref:Uncharacterized protein n=1 Tax=Trichinella pseudospiralis TaxID=6337 RepID=A0A0V1DJU4_TRIPS|nr:hypothetical protein T4A_350 [Trichinella pseudospiralis]
MENTNFKKLLSSGICRLVECLGMLIAQVELK